MSRPPPVTYSNFNPKPTRDLWSTEALLPNSSPCTLQRHGATKASHPRGQIRHLQAQELDSLASSHKPRNDACPRTPYTHHRYLPPPPRPVSSVIEVRGAPETTELCKRLFLSQKNEYAPVLVKNALQQIFVEKGPIEPISAPDEIAQLHRYLLDILAFTLGVDCHKLNVALGQGSYTSTTTILDIQERRDLLQLSLAVQRLHVNALDDQPGSMLLTDKKRVVRRIMRPMAETGFQAFVLDMIASYADHCGDPSRWQNTSLGYWSEKRGRRQSLSNHIEYFVDRRSADAFDPMSWRPKQMERWSRRRKIVQSLASQMKLLCLVESKKEVKAVFEQAIQRYQTEHGLKVWSLAGLADGIFELAIRDGFVSLRTDLKANEREVKNWMEKSC